MAKIKVDRKSLLNCLNMIHKGSAANSKSTLPINSNFLFNIEGESCKAYSKNGKVQMKGLFAVESKQDFSMCVPANTMLNTVRLLDDEYLNLNYNEEKFVLTISAGKKKYKMTGFNPEEFTPKELTSEEGQLVKARASEIIPNMKRLSSIIVWDDMRDNIAGLTIRSHEGKLQFSGANSSNFFYIGATSLPIEQEFGIILPRDVSSIMGEMPIVGDVEMRFTDRFVSFKSAGFEIMSVLIDAKPIVLNKFYDYDQEDYSHIVVNKEEISMAVKRLINYTNENSALIMELKGEELILSSENTMFNVDATEILDIKNSKSEDVTIGMNIKFLSLILSNIEDDSVKFISMRNMKPMFIQGSENKGHTEVWALALLALTPKN